MSADLPLCLLDSGLHLRQCDRMSVSPDEIEFRRVAVGPYALGRQLRDALDIEVNGRSLSHALEGAPFDADFLLLESRWRSWSLNGARVAILTCGCGDPNCGALFIDVASNTDTIEWKSERLGFVYRFDRSEFETSLRVALTE